MPLVSNVFAGEFFGATRPGHQKMGGPPAVASQGGYSLRKSSSSPEMDSGPARESRSATSG
ncbi:MAG: hypothetical protein JWQ56_276 [Pseudarthrobacter sp.]|nr:hypothetical protein [Pseudarthrobacter sp.]